MLHFSYTYVCICVHSIAKNTAAWSIMIFFKHGVQQYVSAISEPIPFTRQMFQLILVHEMGTVAPTQ
jgi:hypothetical protein